MAVLAVAALGLAACDDGDDWSPDAQFAPSLRPAVGVRESGGDLLIWTGTPCTHVTRVTITFDPGTDESTAWELTARRHRGVTVEHLRLDARNPGLRATQPLPQGFAWADADSMSFHADTDGTSWGTTTDLDVVREESADHGDDVYYFDHVGWLDADDVADRNSADFLTPCTPDPG